MTPLVPYETQLATYSFIGDSQAGVFDRLLLRREESDAPCVRGAALWLPHLRAEEFYGPDRFGDLVTRMLWSLRILRPVAAGCEEFPHFDHRVFGEAMNDVSFEVRHRENVLVVCMGVHELLSIANDTSPSLQLDAQVNERLTPLFRGLRALRRAGCINLFVSQLAPPRKTVNAPYSAERLDEVARAINASLHRFCLQEKIDDLDLWSGLTRDGVRDEAFFKDEIHLNLRGALVVLNEIHRIVEGRSEKALVAKGTTSPP